MKLYSRYNINPNVFKYFSSTSKPCGTLFISHISPLCCRISFYFIVRVPSSNSQQQDGDPYYFQTSVVTT